MADEYVKIAAASDNGIEINTHFGKASEFYIYNMDENGKLEFLEQRSVTPVCVSGGHDEEKLRKNLEVLSDCRYLLVARIGDGAADMAETFGIESYELPGEIKESAEWLIKYIKIKKLFQ